MSNKLSPGDRVSVDAGLGITKTGNVQRITESTVFVKHYNGAVVGYRTQHVTKMISEQAAVKPRGVGLKSEFDAFMQVMEKTLTPAELKKREEVAKAMERENPGMDMSKKMAIATATAKKVAEEAEQIDEISKKTAMSYLTKAGKELDAGSKTPEKRDKRIDGYFAAGKRLAGEKPTSEAKAHTIPKTAKEKSLAAIAEPKDKITHADVMVGRGVKEEVQRVDEASPTFNAIRANTLTHATNSGRRSEQGAQAHHDRMQSAADHHHDTMRAYADAALDNHKHNHEQQKKEREAEVNHKIELMKIERKKRAENPGGDPHFDAMHKILRDRTARYKRSTQKEDTHYCAKHVFSERFGEGMVVEGQHAEPNEQGLIEWYDVDFGGTVRRVMTEKVKVMHAEYHMNHKKKMKEEDEIEFHDDEEDKEEMKEMSSKEKMKRGLYNKEEVENIDEKITIDNKGNRIDNRVKFEPHPLASKTDDAVRAYYAKLKAEKDKKKQSEMGEELKGNQHKIDKNKNGKVDAHDFKLLRKESVLDEGFRDAVLKTTAKNQDDNDVHVTTLRNAGLHASQGAGASNHIIVPPEHEKKARELLSKHLKEETEQIDEKLTDDAKQKIQTALGPKFSNNTLRKTSGPARAIIGLAKTNPNNIVKKEEVELEEAIENLPGKATHLTNKDIRHAEHGIIPGSTTLRHLDGNKYEVRAGRAKGKTVELDKQHVQKLSMEEVVAEAMISYSDFQSKIDAHRKAGNQIKDDKYDKKKASYTVVDQEGTAKKITHTDAGVSQQHLGSMKRDDSDDKSAETKPKETRGRGRPAGSKSGARN